MVVGAMGSDGMPRALGRAVLVRLVRGELGWRDGDDPPGQNSVDFHREKAFCDLIRSTNSRCVLYAVRLRKSFHYDGVG